MTEDQREIRRKKSVIEYAEKIGHVGRACRRFGIARAEGVGRRYVANLIPLAFLSTDIVASILSGNQPVALTTQELTKRIDLPLDWAKQRALLGFD